MGKYINPKGMTKEYFLTKMGMSITEKEFMNSSFEEMKYLEGEDIGGIVVVLIDNGAFKAGLICFNDSEYQYIKDNPDSRPKTYWVVPKEDLEEFLK